MFISANPIIILENRFEQAQPRVCLFISYSVQLDYRYFNLEDFQARFPDKGIIISVCKSLSLTVCKIHIMLSRSRLKAILYGYAKRKSFAMLYSLLASYLPLKN